MSTLRKSRLWKVNASHYFTHGDGPEEFTQNSLTSLKPRKFIVAQEEHA